MTQAKILSGPAEGGIVAIVTKALEEGYPKAADTQRKEQEKQVELLGQEDGYKGKVFRADKRRGMAYRRRCSVALEQAFPAIPVNQ